MTGLERFFLALLTVTMLGVACIIYALIDSVGNIVDRLDQVENNQPVEGTNTTPIPYTTIEGATP